MRPVLLDTGPLVAFLNRRDHHHAWAREVLDQLEPPLFTCEAVLSEACFLLRRHGGGPPAVVELVARGLVEVAFDLQAEAAPVAALLTKYADQPTSLADASLVRLAEIYPDARVLTTDADFHVYRKNRRQRIRLIAPAGPQG